MKWGDLLILSIVLVLESKRLRTTALHLQISLVGLYSPAPCSLKPAVSAEHWPLLGLHVLFIPCHHALFISLRPLSVTNTPVQQLACSTPRPRDLMSALSPAVYFQSWDTLYHCNEGRDEAVWVCVSFTVYFAYVYTCLCAY